MEREKNWRPNGREIYKKKREKEYKQGIQIDRLRDKE